jgi:hypothetical protein
MFCFGFVQIAAFLRMPSTKLMPTETPRVRRLHKYLHTKIDAVSLPSSNEEDKNGGTVEKLIEMLNFSHDVKTTKK